MTQFRTAIELPEGMHDITHKSRLLLAGSCFAGNIGAMLAERKFNIETNPFGIMYNPLSIATMLTRVIDGRAFTASSPEIFEHGGKWHSILHHGDFSQNSREQLLEKINTRLAKAHNAAKECDFVIITLGTAYTYTRARDNIVAGNCHNLPASMFTRRLLGIDEIVDAMSAVIDRYRSTNPGIKFVFTISPIRHLRDGAHDNQKSKATLLLATDRIMSLYPDNATYFPAYEILLDELRDYRFYADDMVHPSTKAVSYIWECFGKCYFSDSTARLNNDIEQIMRAMEHRPFDSASDAYKSFLENLLKKITAIEEKHPYLDFENEKKKCNILLNR